MTKLKGVEVFHGNEMRVVCWWRAGDMLPADLRGAVLDLLDAPMEDHSAPNSAEDLAEWIGTTLGCTHVAVHTVEGPKGLWTVAS